MPALAPEVADWVLGRLAGVSLLTFSVDDTSVTAHRLVMRVIREQLAVRNSLTSVCAAAAQLLDGLAEELGNTWHQDRAAVRDLVEHITALYESSASCPADSALLLRSDQGRCKVRTGAAPGFLVRRSHGSTSPTPMARR